LLSLFDEKYQSTNNSLLFVKWHFCSNLDGFFAMIP
jgi:hypothetical protein